jgi:hypothetical protein
MPPLGDCGTQRRIRSSKTTWAVNPELQKKKKKKNFSLPLDWKATVLLFLGLSLGREDKEGSILSLLS